MSIVVADTSPILNLARVGRLDLLRALYREVIIPPAVQRELADERADLPVDVIGLSWIRVVAPQNRSQVMEFTADLDPGESEALALAIEVRADLILLDEHRARTVAEKLGLEITGLAGVLLSAKGAGLIAEVKPVLDEMMQKARFRIGRSLYELILSEAGEF